MRRLALRYRAAWVAVLASAVMGLVALAPHLGHTNTAAPLWSERPVPVAPAAAVPAANWVELTRVLKPAVVNISSRRLEERVEMQNPFGNLSPFGDDERGPRRPRHTVRSMGSGFIINPAGYIVTNNHVVEGATDIRVKIDDGREMAGTVVGRDPKTDLALLKVEATGLPVIPLGDSTQLQVGEPVMAIGNPFGLERTVTTGIVSATGRVIGQGPYDDFIQTDASINPGNSGGPLINGRGQAVGINAAIFSQSGGSVGIGFAIPVNQAKSVVTQLVASGKVTRGWLGVTIQPLTAELAKGFNVTEGTGALVAGVQDGSPAARAGVKAGDIITHYDGQKVATSADLPKLVAATAVGRQVPVTVVREGKKVALNVTVAQMDEPGQPVVAQAEEAKGPLGLTVETVTPSIAKELKLSEPRGVIVRGVRSGSPAENAGIRAGDVITEVDRQAVADAAQMKRALEKHPKGAPVVVMVRRDGTSLYVALAS
ncbi:MAG TPA: DegQ family serine endoprotease [Candidatus Eisenbacteria bacterium]|nr:DegQ family serine endoprotease [Candidatus Eisenbacteria bacterium]